MVLLADGQPGGREMFRLFPTVDLSTTWCSLAVFDHFFLKSLVWTRGADWNSSWSGWVKSSSSASLLLLSVYIVGSSVIISSTGPLLLLQSPSGHSVHIILLDFDYPWSVASRLANVNIIVIYECDLSVKLFHLLIIICSVRYNTWCHCIPYYVKFILISIHVLLSWAPTSYHN